MTNFLPCLQNFHTLDALCRRVSCSEYNGLCYFKEDGGCSRKGIGGWWSFVENTVAFLLFFMEGILFVLSLPTLFLNGMHIFWHRIPMCNYQKMLKLSLLLWILDVFLNDKNKIMMTTMRAWMLRTDQTMICIQQQVEIQSTHIVFLTTSYLKAALLCLVWFDRVIQQYGP